MAPPRFALAVFDMDGVLGDSSACHARAYEDLWRLAGITGPPYHTIAGRTTPDVVRQVTGVLAPSPARIAEWVRFKQERAREYLQSASVVFPDVLPALVRLEQQQVRLAIGTGASSESTRLLLRQARIDRFFEVIVTGDDVITGKPAPDTYALAIQRSACTPDETLVIEDGQAGLASGAAAGAYTASVRTGERIAHPRFLGTYPDLAALLDGAGFPIA